MKTPSDQLLARLGQLVAAGARLYYWDGEPSIALQAVEWIPGQGLLYAERGAQDQSGIHLVEAADLFDDSVGATLEGSIDLVTEGGDLIASVMVAREEVAPEPLGEAWLRFWAQEIQNVKGGE
jgi:hypothetical protein